MSWGKGRANDQRAREMGGGWLLAPILFQLAVKWQGQDLHRLPFSDLEPP